MGALHQGHLSLVKKSVQSSGATVVSIFVNPRQFNDSGDLDRYPRTMDTDIKLLENSGCDIIFAPANSEIYPETPEAVNIDLGALTNSLEGLKRPGHFDGVIQVLRRFFSMVKPDFSFFGEKDFQQLAVVKAFAGKEFPQMNVVPCATVREPSGLAMSSRNALLSSEQRLIAKGLSSVLSQMAQASKSLDPNTVELMGREQLNSVEGLELEYFEIVDSDSFSPATQWLNGRKYVMLVAASVGDVRLIDNMQLDFGSV
jgi:pantoate--beta-alanine ligase